MVASLSAVAALIRERVEIDLRIAAALDVAAATDTAPDVSSVDLPADLRHLKNGRRVFREWCRSGRVRGAVLEGCVWRCTREAWTSARARRASAKPTLRVVATSAVGVVSDEQLAAQALVGAGLRATRRTA